MEYQYTKESLEHNFQRVLDGLMELIFLFDGEGVIFHSNKMALDELRYPSLEGVNIGDIFPQLITEDTKFSDLCEKGRFSSSAYRKNQTCFPVDVKISSIGIEKEVYLCSVWNMAVQKEALKDIHKAKEEVAQATTFRNDFVANVTHELRTPVNGILGHAKNLLGTEVSNEQRKTLEIIVDCCDNMIKIINNLLDFSKLQAGRFTIEEKEFDFRALMEQVMGLHSNAVNEKGLRFVMNLADDIPRHLIGDELCIKQILNNLISNAIKFTSVGQIAIQVTKTLQIDGEIELFFMVMDTGIGIDPEKKDLLFQSFYQADASITRRFGGTGLGLSICKELVELMGGTISIDSVKDKGSTFSFSLHLKLADSGESTEDFLPSGKFVYETSHLMSVGATEDAEEDAPDIEEMFQFGTKDNLEEIHATMEKMLLCIDMGTWEKAENFAGVVKRLVESGDPSLKRLAFRLEMTVRKEDHEKSVEQFHKLEAAIAEAEAAL